MNLTSSTQIKSWCIEHDFHPNKTLGQNFLVDKNSLDAIIEAASIQPGEKVLEVGPGLGVLTEALIAKGADVHAVEKDKVLAARLSKLGFPVVCGDALKMAAAGELDNFDSLVSNLPYSSGTRILLEIIMRENAPGKILVLVQTEVAERLAAPPGSKTRALSSVWAQLDYDVEKLFEIKASCFWPKPQVSSTIVRMTRRATAALPDDEKKLFRKITKQAFEHRRKQLGAIFKGLVVSQARAEELSLQEWITLTKGMKEYDNA